MLSDSLQFGPAALAQVQLTQTEPAGRVIDTVLDGRTPLLLGEVSAALLVVDQPQLIMSLVTAQAGVHAGERGPRLDAQEPDQAPFSPGQVAYFAEQQRLLEEKFCIVGEAGPAGSVRCQGQVVTTQVLVRLSQQGIQLGHERGIRLRAPEGSLQDVESLGRSAQLHVDRAEIEEGPGIARVLRVLQA